MSETHIEAPSQLNGPTPVRRSKSELATSTVDGSVVAFDVVGGESVSIDVAKLHPASQLEQAILGYRTSQRLAIQKMEDPAKIADVLRSRIAKMQAGEPTVGTRRRGAAAKEPDELTQALANLLGKTTDFVENTYYNNWFKSPDSGCEFRTSNGKTRIYGKQKALAILRADARVKAEIDKIVKARTGGKSTQPKNLDLGSFAAT
jgi:hypothetical protein